MMTAGMRVRPGCGMPEDAQWSTYTELDWLEAPPVELAIVLEELGYVADPTPFLATATWFAPLAGRFPERPSSHVPDLALMGLAITTVGACRLERPRTIAVPPNPGRQQCQQAPLKAVGAHAAACPIGLLAGWGISVAHEVAAERSYGGAAKRDQMESAENPEREGV